jgi:hypothetical protein
MHSQPTTMNTITPKTVKAKAKKRSVMLIDWERREATLFFDLEEVSLYVSGEFEDRGTNAGWVKSNFVLCEVGEFIPMNANTKTVIQFGE